MRPERGRELRLAAVPRGSPPKSDAKAARQSRERPLPPHHDDLHDPVSQGLRQGEGWTPTRPAAKGAGPRGSQDAAIRHWRSATCPRAQSARTWRAGTSQGVQLGREDLPQQDPPGQPQSCRCARRRCRPLTRSRPRRGPRPRPAATTTRPAAGSVHQERITSGGFALSGP